MKLRFSLYLGSLLLFVSCAQQDSELTFVCNLPDVLEEVSSVETLGNSPLLWMHNDSGNPNVLYGVDRNGSILKEVYLDVKNIDWEDLTKDGKGNLYVGDFGNNKNKRRDLAIYKVSEADLQTKKQVTSTKIGFYFPNQQKFPPKKKKMYFDVESFFYHQGNLYLFTKSRVKNNHGRTDLYRIPAKAGNHAANFIASYTRNCNDLDCWITSAAISPNGKIVALLSPNTVLLFSNYEGDDFFNGTVAERYLSYDSQKEGICFKDNNVLYITDEYAHGDGGNLYTFTIEKE